MCTCPLATSSDTVRHKITKAQNHSAWGTNTAPGSIPGCVLAGRDWETHEAAYNWPSVVWVRGGFEISVSHRTLATPMVGRTPASWLRSPIVRCLLRHIGTAGFRVKRAVCQEAVRLGRVMFQRMHGSRPSPLPSPYESCSDGTRL
jgi:hypothetical protein